MPPKEDTKDAWANAKKTFKNQNTQLDNKITAAEAEIKKCLDKEEPTIKEYINCESMCDGCKTKVTLLDNYILKMSDLAGWGTTDGGEDSVEARNTYVSHSEDAVQKSKSSYKMMLTNLKELEKKAKKIGIESATTAQPKGTANSLKPDLLTSSIAAGEVETWM